MLKKSLFLYGLLIVLLVIILSVVIFFIINNTNNNPSTGQAVKEDNNNSITGHVVKEEAVIESNFSNFSSDKIHFKEIQVKNQIFFRSMPVKYYIYSPQDNDAENNYTKCSEIKDFNIHKAFSVIANSTNETVNFREVSFEEKSANPSIIEDNTIRIRCDNYKSSGAYIVEGEAGPVIDAESSNIIKTGEVYLYHNGLDIKGDTSGEIHEILHVFGYSHVTDKASIMNPVSRYVMKIDKDIIKDLVESYS